MEPALAERQDFLVWIDFALDMVGELVRQEMALRAADVTPLVGKEHREPLGNSAVVNAVMARLAEYGIGKDVRLSKSDRVPRVADLAKIHAVAVDAVRSGSRTIPVVSRNTATSEVRT